MNYVCTIHLACSLSDLCGAGLVFSARTLQMSLKVFSDCSVWSLTSSRNSQKMSGCLKVHVNVVSGGKKRCVTVVWKLLTRKNSMINIKHRSKSIEELRA